MECNLWAMRCFHLLRRKLNNNAVMSRLTLLLMLMSSVLVSAAESDSYRDLRAAIQKRDATKRKVPVIPPKGQRIRCIIDTDARNEIDDIWAIALAVARPDRFQIEGFVAANYDNDKPGAGPASIETSARAALTVLEKAGLKEKIPVKRGSPPMRYQYEASESEGVNFIVERAMASTADDPLWIIGLGAATDIASAYLKEPRIAERTVVFWHFRTRWPTQCWNFNVIGDVRAARLVFHSDLSFVLFDTGTHLCCPMDESARWVKHGALGKFLHEFRFEHPQYQSATKGFYDLGDIAALADSSIATWEVVECPEVNWDLAYQFKGTKGKILRCGNIDRDKTFSMFEQSLKDAYLTR
jgi:purine nucleosidase